MTGSRQLAGLGLAALALFHAPSVLAQYHRSDPADLAARSITVESTDPVISPCNWARACFRLVLRITANQAGTVDVGHIPIHRDRRMTAIAGSGASCQENGLRGLPDAVVWSRGDMTWREGPVSISQGHPALAQLSFACDGALVPGDEVSVQLALAVDPDGRGIQTARYDLSGLQIAGSRGRTR